MTSQYLVTGGTGFLGSALVRRLVHAGHRVRVLDNNSRGKNVRLSDVAGHFELVEGDIRDAATTERVTRGVDTVCHLAFLNGTEFFYDRPDLVLDVGVKGMVNVMDACIANKVRDFVLVSSSEVYQEPPSIPTDESVPLSIPDPLNPRYSYAAGKIISEVMAINYGRKHFDRVVIVRPHNVYGPDMGWEHVIPQFVVRITDLCAREASDLIRLPMQGTGHESRAIVFIEDFTNGLMLAIEKGKHLGIYHIGTIEEITIARLASLLGEVFGRRIEVVPGKAADGGPLRRCPDITKLRALGYNPRYTLREALPIVVDWYRENAHKDPHASKHNDRAYSGAAH
jgi:nucleoside-diphosphate-sugar epimerase